MSEPFAGGAGDAVLIDGEPGLRQARRRGLEAIDEAARRRQGRLVLGEARLARSADHAAGRTDRGQPLARIVDAQAEPVFGARGEHPIGLDDPERRQVVDHDPEIRCRAVERYRRVAGGVARGVDAGDDPLAGRLLVAGRAVDLPARNRPGRSRTIRPAVRQRGST